jgi:hypothetical protein
MILLFHRSDYRPINCLNYFIYMSLAFVFSLEGLLDDNCAPKCLYYKVLVVVSKISTRSYISSNQSLQRP